MEVKVLWSETAENQIRDIFDYYSFVASPKIANKIIDKIIYFTDKNLIVISSVFDCRQNPGKLKV